MSDHWCRDVLPWEGEQSPGVVVVWICSRCREGGAARCPCAAHQQGEGETSICTQDEWLFFAPFCAEFSSLHFLISRIQSHCPNRE